MPKLPPKFVLSVADRDSRYSAADPGKTSGYYNISRLSICLLDLPVLHLVKRIQTVTCWGDQANQLNNDYDKYRRLIRKSDNERSTK